jgi:hypothetical protein
VVYISSEFTEQTKLIAVFPITTPIIKVNSLIPAGTINITFFLILRTFFIFRTINTGATFFLYHIQQPPKADS